MALQKGGVRAVSHRLCHREEGALAVNHIVIPESVDLATYPSVVPARPIVACEWMPGRGRSRHKVSPMSPVSPNRFPAGKTRLTSGGTLGERVFPGVSIL
jgi:hypothetical protein